MKYLIWLMIFSSILANSCTESFEPIVDYPITSKWIFYGIKDVLANEITYKPNKIPEMNIQFYESGKLYASCACNDMNGEYKISGHDTLVLCNLIITLKYCIDDEIMLWENRYSKALSHTNRFKIKGNKLVLYTTTEFELNFVTQ